MSRKNIANLTLCHQLWRNDVDFQHKLVHIVCVVHETCTTNFFDASDNLFSSCRKTISAQIGTVLIKKCKQCRLDELLTTSLSFKAALYCPSCDSLEYLDGAVTKKYGRYVEAEQQTELPSLVTPNSRMRTPSFSKIDEGHHLHFKPYTYLEHSPNPQAGR